MSITINWRTVLPNSKTFSGTSDQMKKLVEVTDRQGQYCTLVRLNHVLTLRAMSIASGEDFYAKVADAAEKNGTIEVWGEW